MGRQKLNIWLIGEGEGLPIEKNAHLMRMGTLSRYLSEQGHKVTWWTSTFLHGKKKYICRGYRQIFVNSNLRLMLLHSGVYYKKNISLQRVIYHKLLSLEFVRHSKKRKKPDIILCAWPTPQFAKEAVRYGEKNNVPVIIDARDMWPDIFVRAFPAKLSNIANLLLIPLKRSCAGIFRKAYGITGMIDVALLWACGYAGRKPGKNDRTIYIGNKRMDISEEEYSVYLKNWNQNGIKSSDWIICFFSTFGSHIAIDIVIKAVRELSVNYPDIKLVIGGGGDREAEFRNAAGSCSNIFFAGWLNNKEMTSLMRFAKCGAFSIKNTFDFQDTFNTKAIQYLSEGLPVLNSLSGFARTLIAEKNMGITYNCDSVQDCEEKILQLYHNEESRKQMGENALKCFNEMFDAEVVNKQFEEYLMMMYEKYKKERTR